jgi:hypothetical protein
MMIPTAHSKTLTPIAAMPMSDKLTAANQERCDQILECKKNIIELEEQLDGWNKRLESLQDEQKKCFRLASLRLNAKDAWERLDEDQKADKEHILAALESTELPEDLDDFCNSSFPPAIRMDREILLARVKREDFEAKYRDERFFVPPKLRGDKEVIRQIMVKHPAVVETMACTLRDDTDIFLALLSNQELPPQVLQHFSEDVRSDFDLMLRLCSHPDGLRSFSFIDQSLRNDKDFMLRAIQVAHHQAPCHNPLTEPIHILRFASHRLRDDVDVVLAAVQRCGTNLKHASYDLRRNRAVVVAATEQHGRAFRYCLPGETRDELLNDRSFVLENIGKRCPNELVRTSRSCFESLTADRETLLAALEAGLDWLNVPFDMQNDREFVAEAVRRNHKLYLDIPEAFREDYEIAKSTIQADDVDDDVLLEATEQCPALLSDRSAMLSIAKAWWTDVLHETLRYSPNEIRGDKEIMLEAVKNDPTAFQFVSDELATDHDIILAAMEALPSLLSLVETEIKREHPYIVVTAIKHIAKRDLHILLPEIEEDLFENRDVALAWVSQGGSCIEDFFPEGHRNDEEVMLAVARTNWEEFYLASEELLGSKEFMKKAIAVEGHVFADADGDDLFYDFDLALLAFSQKPAVVEHFVEPLSSGVVDEDFEFMVSFTRRVRCKLQEYDTYKKIVKPHMSFSKKHSCSSLSILDQGPETRRVYSEHISSYLGLPTDEEVQMMHSASANLFLWGF